jgi:hypothetical protein
MENEFETDNEEEKFDDIAVGDDESYFLKEQEQEENKPARDFQEEYEREKAKADRLTQTLAENYNRSREPQTQRDDPLEREAANLWEKQKALSLEYETKRQAGVLTQDEINAAERNARDIQMQLFRIAARKEFLDNAPEIQRLQTNAIYEREYGDVRNHPEAVRYAKGVYEMRVAQGAPEDDSTIASAMEEARARFGLSKRKVSDNQRSKYTGTSASNMGRDNNVNKFKYDKSTTRMALAMFGDEFNGDESMAMKKYAKVIGIPSAKEAAKLGY